MLNVAVIMGRLTADPELKRTPNDITFVRCTVAVDRSYAPSGGERKTDFIDIMAWRGTAEFICKYFRKGQMIAVHGMIQTSTYTDNNSTKRKSFDIVANDVNFVGSKSDSEPKPKEKYEETPPYYKGTNQQLMDSMDDDDDDLSFWRTQER